MELLPRARFLPARLVLLQPLLPAGNHAAAGVTLGGWVFMGARQGLLTACQEVHFDMLWIVSATSALSNLPCQLFAACDCGVLLLLKCLAARLTSVRHISETLLCSVITAKATTGEHASRDMTLPQSRSFGYISRFILITSILHILILVRNEHVCARRGLWS